MKFKVISKDRTYIETLFYLYTIAKRYAYIYILMIITR